MTENEYSLVMPFVACGSLGGPYEDDAFVAGYTAGALAETLAQADMLRLKSAVLTRYVQPGLVPQLDLVAMQHGFILTAKDPEDGWAYVTFTRISESEE